jgi:prepilin-type N-terminal cleavage/methylation domain-containing protein
MRARIFKRSKAGLRCHSGFTLLELLVVIAIIAILAALLFPVLSRAKAQAQSTACKNHLSQIGMAMAMYVSDIGKYPPTLGGGPPFETWADRLTTYSPVNWTNTAWQCPTYIANKGIAKFVPPPPGGGEFTAWSSYSYNAYGMSDLKIAGAAGSGKRALGLGNLNVSAHEQQIASPSEMYAVADSRSVWQQNANGFAGQEVMNPWDLGMGFMAITEANAPHSEGYNLLFNDAHVDLVKRSDYLYPPRAAQNWNRDHQPHPEVWAARNLWAVQN